jgi:hypothetical protein
MEKENAILSCWFMRIFAINLACGNLIMCQRKWKWSLIASESYFPYVKVVFPNYEIIERVCERYSFTHSRELLLRNVMLKFMCRSQCYIHNFFYFLLMGTIPKSCCQVYVCNGKSIHGDYRRHFPFSGTWTLN